MLHGARAKCYATGYMYRLLQCVAVVFASMAAACGPQPQTVRGLLITYAPGVEPYPSRKIADALDGWSVAQRLWLDFTGMQVGLLETPPCLVETDFLHQLAHQVHLRLEGSPDWAHMDYRYFTAPPAAGPKPPGLLARAAAWYAVQFCPAYQQQQGPQ